MSGSQGLSRCALSTIDLPEAEELDEEEYDLPPVKALPTLDSILNEGVESEDERCLFLSEVSFTELPANNLKVDTAETSDSGTKPIAVKWCKDPALLPVAHGSVLHHIILKGVSAQITSATDRTGAGSPTAMAVSDLLAVGTLRGLILIFDPSQTLKLCLGNTALGNQYGAITALAFTCDCTRLFCGFAKGQIVIWDARTGKLLRTITDAHPPVSAVLNIKLTDDPSLIVCSDSSSTVFELHFRRTIGTKTCESRCLFSGGKMEVCCIEPLRLCDEFSTHPVAPHCLLAMVSLTKLLMVSLKPSLKILYSSPYAKTHPSSVPVVAWQFVWTQERLDPVLAFCRGSKITFFHVNCAGHQIEFPRLMEINLLYEIINLKWMNSRTLLLQDVLDKLHVMDRESQEELELHGLADIQLVRGTNYIESLESEQNISQTMLQIQMRACYQSVLTYGGQTVFLGAKTIHVISLRVWHERIDVLLKQDKFAEALALGWAFHEGTAKAVIGLPGENQKKKALVKDKMVDVVLRYIEMTLSSCPVNASIQVKEQHFQKAIPVCVTCCILIGKIDLLCGTIYDQLAPNAVALGVFLECLEPHILSNQLTGVTPQIIKDLVVHFEDKGMLDSIEALIVHLDVTTLDIHQEMIQAIDFALKSGKLNSNELVSIGNKVLVYISCCLSGRVYPFGDIPADLVPVVKKEVFDSLTRPHSKNVEPDEEPYHNIRTLLKCNTREFLNVLVLTFEDLQEDKQAVEFQQRIIDILLMVMVEGTEFTPSQIGCLFTFLARQLARAESSLFVNRRLFDQALDFLCNPDNDSQHEESQQALLELLQAGGIIYFDEEKLISLAEKVQFYQVCEFVYKRKRLHSKIFICYLKDTVRKLQVYKYIHDTLSNTAMTKEERLSFQEEILNHIHELVEVSPQLTAELMFRQFSNSITVILETFQDPQLFQFLHGILDPSTEPWPFQDASLLNHEYHEKYIDLLCQRKPDLVTAFLKKSEFYRPEEAIKALKKYQLHHALAYLLEKQGHVQAAFSFLLENLKNKLNTLTESLQSEEDNKGLVEYNIEVPRLQSVQTSLQEIIDLCQKTSGSLDFEQREALWFPLLELTMSSSQQLKTKISSPFRDAIKALIKELLKGMTAHIPPTAILQKIVLDPGYSMGKYGEVKDLVLGMLDAFVYEQTLLETTKNILNHDLHWSLSNLRATVNRGLKPNHKICGICTKCYNDRLGLGEQIIVFSCGHVYHSSCLRSKNCSRQFGDQQDWICFRCMTPYKIGRAVTAVNPASEKTYLPTEIVVKSTQQTPTANKEKLALLLNLARQKTTVTDGTNSITTDLRYFHQSSIIHSENFQLQLAAPPLVD
ncbi:vacuolar protein sorting-associated protein 8 homolog isoform X2 [Heptranchias perlo]|uniref:vacuolar protein sorting-associated protein 8 homolog isoform X2 n=1 Tax=Heptranchias perlo TaxID=212740 RepID=UPI00355A30A2